MSETIPFPVDTVGVTAPPRKNGELVFDAPWQGRAFGMCIALLERAGLGWEAFRVHLVGAIEEDPDGDYYDRFAVALERFAAEHGFVQTPQP